MWPLPDISGGQLWPTRLAYTLRILIQHALPTAKFKQLPSRSAPGRSLPSSGQL
jgi:hypothetical protein